MTKRFLALMVMVALLLSVLAVGASSAADKEMVQKVQTALNELGYDCGTPDGVSGKKTVAAIKSYQSDHDLYQTGLITEELLKSLQEQGKLQGEDISVRNETGTFDYSALKNISFENSSGCAYFDKDAFDGDWTFFCFAGSELLSLQMSGSADGKITSLCFASDPYSTVSKKMEIKVDSTIYAVDCTRGNPMANAGLAGLGYGGFFTVDISPENKVILEAIAGADHMSIRIGGLQSAEVSKSELKYLKLLAQACVEQCVLDCYTESYLQNVNFEESEGYQVLTVSPAASE